MEEIKEHRPLISLRDLFCRDRETNESFSPSSPTNQYYISDSVTDSLRGEVLYFNMNLRDGPVLVFVDDCGHTHTIKTFKDLTKDFQKLCLSKLTEEYAAVVEIYEEYKHSFSAMPYEIYKLRKRVNSLETNERVEKLIAECYSLSDSIPFIEYYSHEGTDCWKIRNTYTKYREDKIVLCKVSEGIEKALTIAIPVMKSRKEQYLEGVFS